MSVGIFKIDAYRKHGRRLGDGAYFAPDPNKSLHYCDKSGCKHVLLCRVNLNGARHGNITGYDEFCVFDEVKVLPLFVVTLRFPTTA